jgi:hypothetical protein
MADAVELQGYLDRKPPVPFPEGPNQCPRLSRWDVDRPWNPNTAQVLRLESQVAAAHANAIAFVRELCDTIEQQATNDLV